MNLKILKGKRTDVATEMALAMLRIVGRTRFGIPAPLKRRKP